jgi:hypothetical protein
MCRALTCMCILCMGVGCLSISAGEISLNPEDCSDHWGQSCGGALRVDDYKIIVGCKQPHNLVNAGH